jgi:MFS family permease
VFDSLRFRNFRLLWLGSVFCYGGHWVQQATLGWVAYELTGSGSLLGLIMGIRAVPILLLAPIAGAVADRHDRRNLLAGTQLIFILTTTAIGAAIALGSLKTWHLFAYVLCTGVAHVFDRTSRQAIISDLVPTGSIVNAVALSNIVFSLMRVVSPAIAGYLLVWVGAAGNFFAQCAFYALGMFTLLLIHMPARTQAPTKGSMWSSIGDGIRHVMRDPTTRMVVFFTAVPFLLLTPIWSTLLPVFARDVFDAGPQALGWLFAAVGSGGLAGGLLSAAFARTERIGWLQIGMHVLFCVSLLGVALAPSLPVALPFVFIAGVAEIMTATVGQTILQVSSPAHMRGRVLSLLQLNPALISIGSIIAGTGADLLGARGISAANGVLALFIGAALVLASPALRNLRLSHYTRRPD